MLSRLPCLKRQQMSSGPLIVFVFIWESPQRDEQGVVSLYKQYGFVWYQKVWCLPMINTQFRGFFTGMPLKQRRQCTRQRRQLKLFNFASRNVYHSCSSDFSARLLSFFCHCQDDFGCSLLFIGYQFHTVKLLNEYSYGVKTA